MRLGSRHVLEETRRVLGLDPSPLFDSVLDLEKGQAVLVGPWAGRAPRLLASAARRTIEGGGDLSGEYWANPGD